ncbi:MAG: hypothetical protein U9R17_10310 [Thermodesulfobacteriota bacterium]|nr:hypothetical protein [Thermodesulfobacteriota bacterium]
MVGLVSPDDTSKACYLASQSVQLDTSGAETQVTLVGYPSDDCLLSEETSRAVNLTVTAHPIDDLLTLSDPNDQTTVLFTASNSDNAVNQACTDASGTAGCVIDLTIEPSPGLDVAITSFEPASSVAILWSPTDSDHHSTDVTLTAEVANKPNFVVDTDIEVVGVSPGAANALDGVGTVEVKYYIRPHSSTDSWMDLTVRKDGNHTAAGHHTGVTLTSLPTPNEISLNHDLYIEGDTYTAMATGGTWASESDFDIQACVLTSFTEGAADASEGNANNCMTARVTMGNPRKPDMAQQQLGYRSWFPPIPPIRIINYIYASNYNYSKKFGNSKEHLYLHADVIMGAGSSYLSDRVTGAKSDKRLSGTAKIGLSASLDGWLDVTLIGLEGWAYADLTDTTVNDGYDAVLLGHTLAHLRESYSMPITYDLPGLDKSYSKSACAHFGYYLVVANISIEVCAKGEAGLKVGETLNFYDGNGWGDFADATVWGDMVLKVRPYTELDLTAAAVVDLAVLDARVEADLTLLNVSLSSENRTDGDTDLEDYTTGIVSLGLVGSSVVFTAGADSDFTISTLSGKVYATGEYYLPFSWHDLGTYTITSWDGYSKSFPIYHGTLATTTIDVP